MAFKGPNRPLLSSSFRAASFHGPGRIHLTYATKSFTSQVRSICILTAIPRTRRIRNRNRPSQESGICLLVRHHSSLGSPNKLPPDQQASYDRLRPIIDTFEAPIDWAVAYGSGVMKQAQVKPGDPTPMTDLLISTPSATEFHSTNLRQNPSHYPMYARLMGGAGIGWAQEKLGAGIWYVTMVEINGINAQARLTAHLAPSTSVPSSSPTPAQSLEPDIGLDEAIKSNHRSALALSLLLCPERFTENYLWEKIAGLSYSGDPRMSVPGAENPEKVKNIVRGPGAREGFREMYTSFFGELGIYSSSSEKTIEWQDDGEALLSQSTSPQHHAALFASLPINLRKAVSTHYQIPGDRLTNTLADQKEKEKEKENQLWIKPIQDKEFRPIVAQELKKIIHSPALRQSIKGLFTAGPVKSFYYSLAKFQKWLKSRAKK